MENNQRLHVNYASIVDIVEKNSTVLDLGSGDGTLLKLLKEKKNVRGKGIEIDENSVIKSIQNGVCTIQGDIDEGLKQISDKEYDYVILNSTLQSTEKPDYVIHCAAYTNVDKAEEDLETARLINAKGTENIAKACKNIDATLVYISTDYVFNGNGDKPYLPADKTAPLNNYGLTKLEGEEAVKNILEKYYICRTSWLYGHHGKNFVETMISLADKSELKVVDDQVGYPTWTVELANAIVKIIENIHFGIYHTCGSNSTSCTDLQKKFFHKLG